MQDVYEITLSNHETIIVPMMQGDTDRKVEAHALETLKYKKATVDVETISGNALQIKMNKVKIDDVNNTILFTVDAQTTAIAGRYKAQITIYDATDTTKILNYYPLILRVDESVKPINSPYETAINDVKKLINEGYKEAESWAHGGTGTRAGENTDNSKYYSNLAKSAYTAISETNEAVLSNRLSAIESGYTLNQVLLGSVTHNLDKYPCVQAFKGKYGAGISAGYMAGGSELQHVNINYYCTNKNTIRLYADKHVLYDDKGAEMTPDKINKVDDNHYTVTFKDGAIYSLQIVLS